MLGLFLIVAPVSAAELRISEVSGLTRLVSDRKGGTDVRVVFASGVTPSTVRLDPVDGLGEPVHAVAKEAHVFVATQVRPGRYTIIVSPVNAPIQAVEVID